MKDIYVVAHTQSEHHVQGLVGGWYDTPLTETGRAQAERVAACIQALVDGRPVEIFASDLKRAHQTAEAVAARLAAPITATSDLRELSYGSAGGKPDSWLDGRATFAPKEGRRLDHRNIPDAESKREVLDRIYRAVETIVARPCTTQVIVTHGYALTFVVAAWIRMPLESAAWVNFKSSPGGITHLQEDDTFFNRAVLRLNDTAHLTG